MELSRDEPANSTAVTAHRYTLRSLSKRSPVTFTAHFSPDKRVPSFPAKIQEKNVRDWNAYWKEGGFVDLTASSNPNATELQRRIIKSQYHVRVNSAATGQSPQESGLMNNGWYGKLRTATQAMSSAKSGKANFTWKCSYGTARIGQRGVSRSTLTTFFQRSTKHCFRPRSLVQSQWAGRAHGGQK